MVNNHRLRWVCPSAGCALPLALWVCYSRTTAEKYSIAISKAVSFHALPCRSESTDDFELPSISLASCCSKLSNCPFPFPYASPHLSYWATVYVQSPVLFMKNFWGKKSWFLLSGRKVGLEVELVTSGELVWHLRWEEQLLLLPNWF